MKNIHILPTEHTSRLYYNSQERTYQLCEFPKYHTDIKSTHNLYITNDEEIKDGDYFYQDFDSIIHKCYKLTDNYVIADKPSDYPKKICKKIIFTTDPQLIKDGVQSIPDEFLEFIVKNPNCEEIEVDFEYNERSGYTDVRKIIIPKEEPKQELERGITITHVGKQETLEEFINEELEDVFFTNISKRKEAERLIELGAKWQQERSYSEEDMKRAFCNGGQLDYSALTSTKFGTKLLNKWFEQFKKK
jgi:hypothetical protein